MRYWVVRARPARNDPFEEWILPQSIGRWHTKRPPKNWEKGDRIFVWASSPQQQIIGLGLLHALPVKPERNGRYWFRIDYLTGVLPNPVARSSLASDPVLRESILMKYGPAFSVVRLTDAEGEGLYRLVTQQNREAKAIWPEPKTRTSAPYPSVIDIDLEGKEGLRSLRSHIQLERNPKLIKAKKGAVLARTGRLECEACGFDFLVKYGRAGEGFCEVHHIKPLSHDGRRTTKLSDLAVVCSNCHRVIHRNRKALSLNELRKFIRGNAQKGAPSDAKKRRA